jgi:phage-related protein
MGLIAGRQQAGGPPIVSLARKPLHRVKKRVGTGYKNYLTPFTYMLTSCVVRQITFYTTEAGRCPVQEHLDTLSDKVVQKVVWVLRTIRDLDRVPANYLKKLVNTDDIWEIRADVGRNTIRLLGFFDGGDLIVLTNSFQTKSQKTPQAEIRLAEERKAEYLMRRKRHG